MTGWKTFKRVFRTFTPCSLVEVYIVVSYQADEHLELLARLLSQQASRQGDGEEKQGSEERDDWQSSNAVQQKLQDFQESEISSLVEIRPDTAREQRKGVPEIIFGETKDAGQIIVMARALLAGTGRALVSRVQPGVIEALREAFPCPRHN